MSTFVNHLLETNLYLLLFAGAYGLFLKSETFFRLNRAILLGMVTIAFTLPYISFPAIPTPGALYVIQLPTIEIGNFTEVAGESGGLSIYQIVLLLYATGAMFFAIRFTTHLFTTLALIRSRKISSTPHSGLTEIESEYAPSSFFKYIFWNRQICDENAEMIREHEAVHALEWHSLDLILMRLAEIVCWCNPAIYFLKKSVEANHEFRADQVVASHHKDIYQYSNVLLGQAMGVNHQVLAHHFSKPKLLKTRIMMLNKKQSQKSALLKYLFLIPVLGLSLAFNSCSKEDVDASDNINEQQDIIPPTPATPPTPGEKVPGTDYYKVVDVMPVFPGGNQALMTFLGENIIYPETAKSEGKEGTVYVQFIIDKDGSIRDVQQVKEQKERPNGPDSRLVESAIAAVRQMPDWTPGTHKGEKVNVQYNLPVKYQFN